MTLGFPKHVPVRSPDNIRDIAHFHHPEPRYKYQTRWSLSGLVAFGYDLYECRYQNFLLPPQSKARGGGRWGVWSTCRLAHAFRSVDSVPVALWTKNKRAHKVSTSPLRPEDTPFGPPTKFCSGPNSPTQSIVQNFIFIGCWVVSEPMRSENHNLPFVWVTALTILYALTCYTMILALPPRHLSCRQLRKLRSSLHNSFLTFRLCARCWSSVYVRLNRSRQQLSKLHTMSRTDFELLLENKISKQEREIT